MVPQEMVLIPPQLLFPIAGRIWVEAVERFHLAPHFQPLRRCLGCNALLAPVDKASVADRIPPKTRLWCDQYLECPACSHLYWPGSHHDNMLLWVAGLKDPPTLATDNRM